MVAVARLHMGVEQPGIAAYPTAGQTVAPSSLESRLQPLPAKQAKLYFHH